MAIYRDRIGTDVPTLGIELADGPEGVLAVYFRFTDKPIVKTIEADIPDVLVDVDADGEVVGLELLNPSVVDLKKILKKIATKYKAKPLERYSKGHSERLRKLQELIA